MAENKTTTNNTQSTTIHLSDDLYKKVKTLAVCTGKHLYEIIEYLLQKGYDAEMDDDE